MNVMACLEYAVKELRVGRTSAAASAGLSGTNTMLQAMHFLHLYVTTRPSRGAVLLHAQVKNIICCGHYGCGERAGVDL